MKMPTFFILFSFSLVDGFLFCFLNAAISLFAEQFVQSARKTGQKEMQSIKTQRVGLTSRIGLACCKEIPASVVSGWWRNSNLV